MNILYHLTMPKPILPGTEAVTQEVEILQNQFGGQAFYLNQPLPVPLPHLYLFMGLRQLPKIKQAERRACLHHLFNPNFHPFYLLKFLNKPIVYSVFAHIDQAKPAWLEELAARVHTIILSNEQDQLRLQEWGIHNTALVRPGIDIRRFTCTPFPLKDKLVLMVGSAPWDIDQFQRKGVDLLLQAAQAWPHLQLIFLWRGHLLAELEQRIQHYGLADQVEVINRRVDVNQILARVHASIVLTDNPSLIKAYPHSLLESLAAGKPVILSRCIALTTYVEQYGCGVGVTDLTLNKLHEALTTLTHHYPELQANAQRLGGRDFSQQRLLEEMGRVYQKVLGVVKE